MERTKEATIGTAWVLGGLAMQRVLKPNFIWRAQVITYGLAGGCYAMQKGGKERTRLLTSVFMGALSCSFLAGVLEIFQRQIPNLFTAIRSRDVVEGIASVRWMSFNVGLLFPMSAFCFNYGRGLAAKEWWAEDFGKVTAPEIVGCTFRPMSRQARKDKLANPYAEKVRRGVISDFAENEEVDRGKITALQRLGRLSILTEYFEKATAACCRAATFDYGTFEQELSNLEKRAEEELLDGEKGPLNESYLRLDQQLRDFTGELFKMGLANRFEDVQLDDEALGAFLDTYRDAEEALNSVCEPYESFKARLARLASAFVQDEDTACEILQGHMGGWAGGKKDPPTRPKWLAALKIDDETKLEDAVAAYGLKNEDDLKSAGILPVPEGVENAELVVIERLHQFTHKNSKPASFTMPYAPAQIGYLLFAGALIAFHVQQDPKAVCIGMGIGLGSVWSRGGLYRDFVSDSEKFATFPLELKAVSVFAFTLASGLLSCDAQMHLAAVLPSHMILGMFLTHSIYKSGSALRQRLVT